MELNKCKRCGAFFVSSNNVCPNCEPKDNIELSKLETFLSENSSPTSIETLAYDTGISVKNLNRFIEEKNISSISSLSNKSKNGNISIGL